MTHDMTTHGGGGQRGCNGSKLQQAQHAIATMMKRMLHEDGTEHEVNSTASSGRSWEGDIDASWTMKEKAVGVGGRGRPGECRMTAFPKGTTLAFCTNRNGAPPHSHIHLNLR